MPQTIKQFAIFNAPINTNDYLDPADAWLFSEPVKTFDIGTPMQTVYDYYRSARNRKTLTIGQSRIKAKLILKVRHVHYSDFTKVIGVDVDDHLPNN